MNQASETLLGAIADVGDVDPKALDGGKLLMHPAAFRRIIKEDFRTGLYDDPLRSQTRYGTFSGLKIETDFIVRVSGSGRKIPLDTDEVLLLDCKGMLVKSVKLGPGDVK